MIYHEFFVLTESLKVIAGSITTFRYRGFAEQKQERQVRKKADIFQQQPVRSSEAGLSQQKKLET